MAHTLTRKSVFIFIADSFWCSNHFVLYFLIFNFKNDYISLFKCVIVLFLNRCIRLKMT